MDLEAAEAQLNAFVERRARSVVEDRAGQEHANDLEEFWRRSEARHRERQRRENRAAWYCHFSGLADALRKSAEAYDARAAALLEDGEREEKL